MNRKLLLSISILCASVATCFAQVRYVDPVFTRSNVKISKNVWYADGYSVLTGTPKLDSLYMDVYEPMGDAVTARPLIIYCHTGSFLPRYVNQLTTGARDDSATVEMCHRFAMKGYVVASISYRMGWNPYGSTEDIRKNTIINAAYRGVQDLSTAVRHFKNSVTKGNMWKIDSTLICVGGQGTGGYITMAYASLDRQPEIKIDKFWDFNTNKAMVSDTIFGDRKGLPINGSPYARNNFKAQTSNSRVAFNIGGAMGDTSWLEAGEIPLICIHPIQDPFAPYRTGMVKVPGTTLNVVEVSGGYDIMAKENMLGNNAVYKNKVNDVYTTQANKLNNGNDGLFPIAGAANGSAPWEWWDSAYIRGYLTASGKFTQSQITTINQNSSLSNPFMSKTRALKYIDSMQGYLAPRIALSLGLITADVKSVDISGNVQVIPNPSDGNVTILNRTKGQALKFAGIYDLNGRLVRNIQLNGAETRLKLDVTPGIYILKMDFENATASKKLIVQ